MSSYDVRSFEPGLWTVGFLRPDTGKWEPASDHDSREDAWERADWLNGHDDSGDVYVYIRSEPDLWTVGLFYAGTFDPRSDHATEAEAADETAALNGSSYPDPARKVAHG